MKNEKIKKLHKGKSSHGTKTVIAAYIPDLLIPERGRAAAPFRPMAVLDKWQCCDGNGRYTLSGEGSRAMRSPITPTGS